MRKSLIFSGILIIQLLSIDKAMILVNQYRSAIFYHDEKQKEIAEKSKSDLSLMLQGYDDP